MNDDRRRILSMLAEGKLSVEECERLLAALSTSAGTEHGQGPPSSGPARPGPLKYLCVRVDARDEREEQPTHVNVRVPLQVLRAGVRLTSLLPPEARARVDRALSERGIDLDLARLKPDNIDELIAALSGTTVDVNDGGDRVRVQVFCE